MKFQYKSISADSDMVDGICDRIMLLIGNKGYTQKQIAYDMGVAKSTVSKWVNGESLSLDALYNLSRYFGCSIDFLLTGKGFAPRKPGEDSFETDEITNDIKTFYRIIKGETLHGLSLASALNFLIADDLTYERGRIPNIDSRFIDAWTTYLSIDVTADSDFHVEDRGLKIDNYLSLETLEHSILLNILKLLVEKKKRFQSMKAFTNLQSHNKERAKKISAEMELDELKYGYSYESYTEDEFQQLKELAPPDNPIPWEEGGRY